VEKIRLHKDYSFDDSNLVSSWTLTEIYGETDQYIDIHDYSASALMKTLETQSLPHSPKFKYDSINSLSLCFIHDVEDCLSIDTKENKIPQTVSRSYRLERPE